MKNFISRFGPTQASIGHSERLRASLGALAGVMMTGLVCRLWLGSNEGLPMLIAPMGASAVLAFAVPSSPLAQPWSILGGNIISAIVGIAVAHAIADPVIAAGMAIAGAIAVMSLLRCLHPPGGAVALTAVLGGPAIHAAGFYFAMIPVGINSLLLTAVALLFNNATRHSYPHRVQVPHGSQHHTADPAPADRIGFTPDDLDKALKDYGEVLDVSRGDLDVLLHNVERRAHQRIQGPVSCSDIMSRDIVTVSPDTGTDEIMRLLRHHAVHAVPVVDDERQAIGVCVDRDLLFAIHSDQSRADAIMRPLVPMLEETAPIEDLMPFLLDSDVPCVLVINDNRQLTGIITRTDLIAVLYRAPILDAAPAQDEALAGQGH